MKLRKFRAWIKSEKIMGKVSLINYSEKTIQINSVLTFYPFHNAVLMQDTGIKDMNGNSVFEGDIVECYCEEDLQHGVDYDYEHYVKEYKRIGQIVIENGYVCCLTITDDIKDFYPLAFIRYEKDRCKCFEVIGNVYENSYLLEEKDESKCYKQC